MTRYEALQVRARGAEIRAYRPDGSWVESRIRKNGVGIPSRQWRSSEQPEWRFCLYGEAWCENSVWYDVTSTPPHDTGSPAGTET